MLTVADKAGMAVGDMLTLAEKGVRPLILADKICEQTLLYVPCVGEGVKTERQNNKNWNFLLLIKQALAELGEDAKH